MVIFASMKMDFDLDTPEEDLRLCQKKAVFLSLARLVLFFLLVGLIIVGISEWTWLLFIAFPVAALFIYLIVLFNAEKDKEAFYTAVLQIQSNTGLRKNRDLKSFDKGEEFIQKKHAFSSDLDLFGDHSLFQLINHTVSKGGKQKLADWMLSDTNVPEAQKRNRAIQELKGKEEFLKSYEAFGMAFLKEEKSKKPFYNWIKSPGVWKNWFFIPAITGPLVGFSVLSLVILGYLSPSYLSLFILVGILFLGIIFRPMLAASKAMPDEGDLKTYTAWSGLLEKEAFENPYLQTLQKPFYDRDFKASKALQSLQQMSFTIQNRANMVYLIFNLFFWVDFLVLFYLESWKASYAAHIQNWEATFQEWEALVSLGAFSSDEALVGEIEWSDKSVLEAQDIRHPLITKKSCVGNDFNLDEETKTVLLTGSNMSGKTTFMRTVGINMVLVNLGLNPMAQKLKTGAFSLFTSMRNTDNLGESVSSFYAELARIKALLDRSDNGKPVFFLLDEILKGTNTTDRIMGSEALVRQLLAGNTKGIISTHDIELSELEEQIPSLANYSFHSEIRENEILFDYKIKKGPCPSFNAHKLMELMGIRFS